MHAQAPHGTPYGEFRILAGIPVVEFGLSLVVFHEQPQRDETTPHLHAGFIRCRAHLTRSPLAKYDGLIKNCCYREYEIQQSGSLAPYFTHSDMTGMVWGTVWVRVLCR